MKLNVQINTHFCYQNLDILDMDMDMDMDMCVNLFKSYHNKIYFEMIFFFFEDRMEFQVNASLFCLV